MDSPDIQRVRHILLYCRKIEKSLQRHNHDFAELCSDEDFYDSLCMKIMQIGELSVGLSTGFKEKTAEVVPWAAVRGIRNIVVHTYRKLHKPVIWSIATTDIPALRAFCEQTIAEAENT